MPQAMTVFSPRAYQLFQRDASDNGLITFAGQLSGYTSPVTVEARFDGGDWITVQENVTFRFNATLPKPAGQYTVDIRADTVTVTYQYVGVGDVFVVAGQSNASGRGVAKQVYTHPTLKASLFNNGYGWQELLDWTDSPVNALDTIGSDGTTASAYGSIWPLLATHIMAYTGVPVGFMVVAKGGTSITQWQPATDPCDVSTLFGAMVRRVRWSGTTPKAVLWYQGETDADLAMPADTYAEYLRAFIGGVRCLIGTDYTMPVIAAKITQVLKRGDGSNMPPIRVWMVNKGIEQCQQLAGVVDLSDIAPDDSAGQHITSSAKLAEAASRWWSVLQMVFYS